MNELWKANLLDSFDHGCPKNSDVPICYRSLSAKKKQQLASEDFYFSESLRKDGYVQSVAQILTVMDMYNYQFHNGNSY